MCEVIFVVSTRSEKASGHISCKDEEAEQVEDDEVVEEE